METEIISQYTRQEAIDDHVLIDIQAPLYNNNNALKTYLGHNDSICITDFALNEINNLTDKENSIEEHLQNMGMKMISQVLKSRENKELPTGNELIFDVIFIGMKNTMTLKIKSVTHIEPNFKGIEKAKCITFMMKDED